MTKITKLMTTVIGWMIYNKFDVTKILWGYYDEN